MQHPLFLQVSHKIAQLQDILEDQVTLSSSYSTSVDKEALEELKSILKSLHNLFVKLREALEKKVSSPDNDDAVKFNTLVAKYERSVDSLFSGLALDESQKKELTEFKLPAEFLIPERNKSEFPYSGRYRDNIEQPNESDEEEGVTITASADPMASMQQNKSVRFKQKLIESSPPKLFKPYKDDIDEELDIHNDNQNNKINDGGNGNGRYKDSLFETMDPDSSEIDNPPIDLSNRQIFIHNQQQFSHQDDRLDELHNSIKQQREISMHINRETSDQFVLLNDLERGIESSNSRLIRSTNKLQQYRDALKKRGDWMCIIILTFVLLVLLVLLKWSKKKSLGICFLYKPEHNV